MSNSNLKRTALWSAHKDADAQLVDFAGWEMPIQYKGIIDEVAAVRKGAGMFDVSHMGRVMFTGKGVVEFLDYILGANVAKLTEGAGKYTLLCNDAGRIIDDCIVYNLGDGEFMLVLNAARMEPDMEWINAKISGTEVALQNVTSDVAMLAVQGPDAVQLVDDLSNGQAGETPRFSAARVNIGGMEVLAARTGYTGEDGFELMPKSTDVAELWKMLMAKGVKPCGLGARDVLRLEAGLMLYGNDITMENHPYEARLGWTISLKKEADYVAKAALVDLKAQPLQRKIAGLRLVDGGVPRRGMAVFDEAGTTQIGTVTSGTFSPTVNGGIAMAYLDGGEVEVGSKVNLDVRGKMKGAEVVKLPFYKAGA